LEGTRRGLDGGIGIVRVAARNARPRGASEGILRREISACGRRDARAVDEMAVGPQIPGSCCRFPAAHGPLGGIEHARVNPEL